MKDFLKDLGKQIGETVETITSKTGEVVELQKIKNQIRTLERGNERDFEDMGRMIYDQYKDGAEVGAGMISLCEAIEQRDKSIEEFNQQLNEVKGANECSSCGNYVAKGMSYCPFCGTKVVAEAAAADDIFEEEEMPAADVAEETAEKAADVAEAVADKAEDIVEEVKDTVSDTAEQVKQTAAEVTEEVKDSIDDIAD